MKNKKAVIGFVCSLVGLILGFCLPISLLVIGSIICGILGIVGIVLGFMTKKEIDGDKEKGEGLRKASVIIGFVLIGYLLLANFMFYVLGNTDLNISVCSNETLTSSCKKENGGVSKCSYMGQYEIVCKDEVLNEKQYINSEEVNKPSTEIQNTENNEE